MPATLDAAALCKMADRDQIVGGILDGPLAFDNAISKEARSTKGIRSEVAGDPDILLVPDLEAGNILAKQLTFLANADSAGLVLGARVPIILTSRADSVRSRIASCAVALLAAHARRRSFRLRRRSAGMNDYALVLNAGSSSLKFCIFEVSSGGPWRVEARGQIEGIGTAPRFTAKDGAGRSLADDTLDPAIHDARAALDALAVWLRSQYQGARVLGVGHRVVHGGARYAGPALITPECWPSCAISYRWRRSISRTISRPIEAVAERLPDVPQVACFDTSFHRGLPAVAQVVPLPGDIREQGRPALRLPRPLVRIHRVGAARGRSRYRRRAGDRRSSRQRREPVRLAEPARAWTPRWDSRRSMGCAWGRDRARSIRE